MERDQLFHTEFQWNGVRFKTPKELIDHALIHASHWSEFLKDWFNHSGEVEVKTSGSTGVPKPIRLSKQRMIASAKATAAYFDMVTGAKVLHSLPCDYIAGKMMMVRALVMGWQLTEIEPKAKLTIPEGLFDFGAMVPLQASENISELHRIKTLLVGGGVISDALGMQLQELDSKVYSTYGMTETITHIACKPVSSKAGFDPDRDLFEGLPGVSFNKDSRGCLCIEAPRISDQIVITNDLIDLVSNREFRWLGRYDNIINSGGIKLVPEVLEKVLRQLIDQRFFLDAVPDKKLGQQMILVIEGPKDAEIMDRISLFQSQNTALIQRYELPKKVLFISTFKETETGKIQRKETLKAILSSD